MQQAERKGICVPSVYDKNLLERLQAAFKRYTMNRGSICRFARSYPGIGRGQIVVTEHFGPAIVVNVNHKKRTLTTWRRTKEFAKKPKKFTTRFWGMHTLEVLAWRQEGGNYTQWSGVGMIGNDTEVTFIKVCLTHEESKRLVIQQLFKMDQTNLVPVMFPEERARLPYWRDQFGPGAGTRTAQARP